jgi:ABC-type uncharacterized transport system substrate-binding protein
VRECLDLGFAILFAGFMISRITHIFLTLVVLLCFARVPAQAHPHVWITASSELVYASDGSLTGVRHAWTFDDMFSTYVLQGIENKTKGVYTRDELAEVAKTNVDSLKEFGFFTFARAGENGSRKKQKFEQPVDYYLEHKDGALTLHFFLPLQSPIKSKELALEIFDPSFFVDFALAKQDPIKLVGAPEACKMTIERPSGGAAQSQTLGEQNFADGGNANYGVMFANKITVDCP